jgi:hypothetical protein
MPRSLMLFLLAASSLAAQQAPYSKPAGQNPPSAVSQQPACLWLTQGSAEKYLGGDVSLQLSSPDTPKRFCRFVQQQSQESLEIRVSKDALLSCPAASAALRGIGNQASMCKAPGAHGEMVSGRVRDFFFSVTHSSRTKKTSTGQDDALAQIAEQVAGNLF